MLQCPLVVGSELPARIQNVIGELLIQGGTREQETSDGERQCPERLHVYVLSRQVAVLRLQRGDDLRQLIVIGASNRVRGAHDVGTRGGQWAAVTRSVAVRATQVVL